MAANEEVKNETAGILLKRIGEAAAGRIDTAGLEQLAHAYSLVVRPGGAPRS